MSTPHYKPGEQKKRKKMLIYMDTSKVRGYTIIVLKPQAERTVSMRNRNVSA